MRPRFQSVRKDSRPTNTIQVKSLDFDMTTDSFSHRMDQMKSNDSFGVPSSIRPSNREPSNRKPSNRELSNR